MQTTIQLLATEQHPCSYLEQQQAVTLFAQPSEPMSMGIYAQLIDRGFRRSGSFVYRPQCPACSACIATRIPVQDFTPNRNQRRVANKNKDLRVVQRTAGFIPSHFQLYQRYVNERHPGGGMDQPEPDSYLEFLNSPWSDTRFIEFHQGERLLAVSVADVLPQGLSAVYTFFDPHYEHLSLGTYAILHLIEICRQGGLPWVYLGYWISGCRKMSYKTDFRPIELFQQQNWRLYRKNQDTQL